MWSKNYLTTNPKSFTLYTAPRPPPFTFNPLLPAGKLESELDKEETINVIIMLMLINCHNLGQPNST